MALPSGIRRSVARQGENLLVTGNRFKRFDQIRQRHFWSTTRFTPDTNQYLKPGDFEVFQTPPGQAGQGFLTQLTGKQTNWPSANRVPDNQNFEMTELGVTVTSLRLAFQNVDAGPISDIEGVGMYPNIEATILQNLRLSITYLTNSIPLGMSTDFAQASGVRRGTHQPFTALGFFRRNFTTNGFAAPALRRRFKIPILLQHGETFRFTFTYDQGRQPWVGGIANPDTNLFPQLNMLSTDVRLDFWATESFVEKS